MSGRLVLLGSREGAGVVASPGVTAAPLAIPQIQEEIDQIQEEVAVLVDTSLNVPLVVGAQVVPTAVPQAWTLVGSATFDASTYASVVWKTLALTANAANATEVRLFNRTDNVQIDLVSTVSTTPELLSRTLALTAGLKTYEVQVRSAAVSPETSSTVVSSLLELST